jgi:hypothetical protein
MTPAQNTKNLLADTLAPLVTTEVGITGAIGLTSAAFGKMHICSGTSTDYIVDLPAVAISAGKLIGFRMSSALTKLVTLDAASTELIDGLQTRIMWANEVAILFCDGVSWTKIAGKTIPMSAIVKELGTQQFNAAANTKVLFTTAGLLSAPAGMQDASNSQLVVQRPCNYNVSAIINWTNNNVTPTNHVLQIMKTGGVCVAKTFFLIPASTYYGQTVERLISLAAGDIVYANALYDAGAHAIITLVGDTFGSDPITLLQAIEVPNW